MQCWQIQLDNVYQHQLISTDQHCRKPNEKGCKKDADLGNEELPIDRVLGVHWNVEKNLLCFKLNLKARNITRRRILSTLRSLYDPSGLA